MSKRSKAKLLPSTRRFSSHAARIREGGESVGPWPPVRFEAVRNKYESHGGVLFLILPGPCGLPIREYIHPQVRNSMMSKPLPLTLRFSSHAELRGCTKWQQLFIIPQKQTQPQPEAAKIESYFCQQPTAKPETKRPGSQCIHIVPHSSKQDA